MITDKDWDNICAFKLKMISNMPHRVYDQLRHAFHHKVDISSEWIILRCLSVLSGLEPKHVDCCINSCVAFTREYVHAEECPFCAEARYSPSCKPRRIFSYLPLIPRLQAFFQAPTHCCVERERRSTRAPLGKAKSEWLYELETPTQLYSSLSLHSGWQKMFVNIAQPLLNVVGM